MDKPKPKPAGLEQDAAVRMAQALVRIPSVTPVDVKDAPTAKRALNTMTSAALSSGASATRMTFSGGHDKWDYPVENVYLEWTFGKPDKHICYIGHLDVVPPGDAEKWSSNPYNGDIRDGYLHGRGVTEMKGAVAAFATAVKEAAADLRETGNIRISMVLTTDEEWAAVNGTDKMLAWMKKNGKTPDAFIVGEPGSPDKLGSHIKLGRRGSLVGKFNAAGVQGHAANNGAFENPNRALALAVAVMNSHAWQDGNEYFPATNFETIAVKSGDFAQSAIVPGKAEALWNIRFTPEHTPDSLEDFIKDKLANPPEWAQQHPDAALLKKIAVIANKDTASTPYFRPPGALAGAAQSAIKDITGQDAVYDGSGGTTDGRFVSKYFPDADIIELGLPERGGVVGNDVPADYKERGGMHQIDERAALRDIAGLRDIYKKTVLNYDGMLSKQKRPVLHPPHPGG